MIGKELAGEYRIVSELAEGGMGIVYKGIRLSDNTPVAVKVLRQDLLQKSEERIRFIREAMIYTKLIHPNLIRFFAFRFVKELGFCLITELLIGQDLEELLARTPGKPIELKRALDIALQICAGLSAAHQAGIIHRDLKPGNIFLVEKEGADEQVKIFDFGIGKLLEQEEGSAQVTMYGAALGTPLYMAPEQIRGALERLGPATDIYAVGIILFQLLTGKLPFTGNSPMEILAEHLRTAPPLLRKYERHLAGTGLEDLVNSLLAKEPIDRPQSIDDVKEQLWSARQTLAPDDLGATQFEMPNLDALREMFGDEFPNTGSQEEEQPAEEAQPERERPVAVLLLREDQGEREVGWLLPGERLDIGSSSKSAVRIKNKGVAPQHASLFCSPQGWITISRARDAIVRVNGAAVVSMVIRDDDWITLGGAELRLHCFPEAKSDS
ncbi:MAG: serine/threonine protein kinase [Deltaproteobacteria bacterium]|nr:MAG: serine/threonine protein kinase [Deltaproteobacteria bacterium]